MNGSRFGQSGQVCLLHPHMQLKWSVSASKLLHNRRPDKPDAQNSDMAFLHGFLRPFPFLTVEGEKRVQTYEAFYPDGPSSRWSEPTNTSESLRGVPVSFTLL